MKIDKNKSISKIDTSYIIIIIIVMLRVIINKFGKKVKKKINEIFFGLNWPVHK